jgi:molybdenum cofactor cytidylyltransferase
MGKQKMLLPFRGSTVIAHIVDTLLSSAVERTYVVVGYRAEDIALALSGRAVSIVTNSDFDAGMLSSVRSGLQALPRECTGVLIALGDQPRIRKELVNDMAQAFLVSRRRIVVPVAGGQRGHPLLFSAEYRAEIAQCYGDVGLRGLLLAHPDDVFELAASSDAVLSDMDDPDDYRREREAFDA